MLRWFTVMEESRRGTSPTLLKETFPRHGQTSRPWRNPWTRWPLSRWDQQQHRYSRKFQLVSFELSFYAKWIISNISKLSRHFGGKGLKYGGTDVPVFWLAEVEVSRLLRSAPGIKMRQGNIKTTSLEKILSWSKMKPLKHNPGEVLNMWAANITEPLSSS